MKATKVVSAHRINEKVIPVLMTPGTHRSKLENAWIWRRGSGLHGVVEP